MSGRSARMIYVGNLPGDVREWEVEDLFYKYGHIVDIELKIPPRPPAYCFVEFENSRDAEDAIRGRDGYSFAGHRLRVELAHGGRGPSSSTDRRSGGGGGGGGRFGGGGVSRRSEYRVIVRGLPSSASWQDLKDHMRKAGDVCFAQVFRDGDGTMGLVDYTNYDDMKYAIRKLDDTEFRNPFARAYIRVKSYEGSVSRSRSRSHSRSRSRTRSRSRSPRRNKSKSPARSPSRSRSKSVSRSRSASPARLSRSRSRSRSISPRPVGRRLLLLVKASIQEYFKIVNAYVSYHIRYSFLICKIHVPCCIHMHSLEIHAASGHHSVRKVVVIFLFVFGREILAKLFRLSLSSFYLPILIRLRRGFLLISSWWVLP